GLLAVARSTATDDKAELLERLPAVDALGWEPTERGRDIDALGRLLVPQTPDALQSAVVTALGRVNDSASADALAAAWRGYSPARQTQVLDVLLSRNAWQARLLDAIEKKAIPAAQIDAARRQRLMTHKDAKVRARAVELFAGAT